MIPFKILILLFAVNFAPTFATYYLHNKWIKPLDMGYDFIDGRPVLGNHKTIRGALSGIFAGTITGYLLGFPIVMGFLVGFFSMIGDILSSFIKRRINYPIGSVVIGLDQIFEGIFPFFVIVFYYNLQIYEIIIIIFIFSIGTYIGSRFFKDILLKQPFENYKRPLSPKLRLREWRACQLSSNPFNSIINFERAIYCHIFMR
ncbi:MAG: CDP-archaeol synthase, partial [Desulfobacterales bacterium]|nr:CDP-archaeol synthase [Desulfobacterales bacterium]